MLATPATALPADDGPLGLRDEVGRHARPGRRSTATTCGSPRGPGNDATSRFPELLPIGAALGVDALLDGEIVALDDAGAPSFELLQPRMQAARPVRGAGARRRPRRSCSWSSTCSGWPATRPATSPTPSAARCSSASRSRARRGRRRPPRSAPASGRRRRPRGEPRARARRRRRQADRQPRTCPGKRADAWRKVKTRLGQELVVGGWLPGAGRLEGQLGSLLVGYHDAPAALAVRGRVGSGIDATDARAARAPRSRPCAAPTRRSCTTPKLPKPQWVEPELVVEVGFHEWTSQGVLRGAALSRVARRQARRRRRARDLDRSRYRPAHDRRPGRARRHRPGCARPRRHGHARASWSTPRSRASTR